MYSNSLGDPANLQNHEIRTRKKVHVTRVGIHAAFGGWSGGGGVGELLQDGYLEHLRKRWRSVNEMVVMEVGFEEGRKTIDRAQFCPFWCQRL